MKYFMINSFLCFSFVSLLTVHVFGSQVESSENCPALFDAIISNDIAVIETLLEYGTDLNASLENCPLASLNASAWRGPFPSVELFSEQSTLLHLAAYFSYYRTYDRLVAKGANEEVIDHQGFTPGEFKRYVRNYTFRMPRI